MKIQSVQQLMTTALTYILDMEEKIGLLAPTMAEASSNPELKELLSKTSNKSKEYAQKVEEVFRMVGEEVKRNDNHIVQAMITEVQEMIKNTDAGPVRDSALIVAANQQQLFRVASYGSVESYARMIGKQDAAKSLTENLEDSKAGDKKFTELAESTINNQAAEAGQTVAA